MADEKPPKHASQMTDDEFAHAVRTGAWRRPTTKPALPPAADLSPEEFSRVLDRMRGGYYAS